MLLLLSSSLLSLLLLLLLLLVVVVVVAAAVVVCWGVVPVVAVCVRKGSVLVCWGEWRQWFSVWGGGVCVAEMVAIEMAWVAVRGLGGGLVSVGGAGASFRVFFS